MNKFILLLIFFSICSISFGQDEFPLEEVQLDQTEAAVYPPPSSSVVHAPLKHDYGIRTSRFIKYMGIGISAIGLYRLRNAEDQTDGTNGAVLYSVGSVLTIVSMIVQDIQTSVLLNNNLNRYGNNSDPATRNDRDGIIFFENDEFGYFNVIMFIDTDTSSPSVLIEYNRNGDIFQKKMSVNSNKLHWDE